MILCYDSIYRIDSLTATTIIILKSNITPDYKNISIFDPIDQLCILMKVLSTK